MPPINPDVCRMCLSVDVRMFTIAGSSLQSVFETLTNTKLFTADKKPLIVCYICHTQLKKCNKFMEMSARAEVVLTTLLKNYGQITKESLSLIDDQLKDLRGKLTFTKPDQIDTTQPPATVEVKIEPEIDDRTATVQVKIEPENNDIFIPSPTVGVEFDIAESDILIEDIYDNVDIKFEDFVECSDVTIVEVKTEELDIVEMENECDGPPNAEETEDFDVDVGVDIENVPISRGSTLLEELCLDHEYNTLLKEGKSKVGKQEDVDADKKPKPVRKLREKSTKRTQRNLTDERLYECDVCQSRFYQKAHLITHTRIHTGEKPYQCKKCQKSFSDKSTLNSHLLYHTGYKPHECNICQQRFYKKYHLNRHLTIHTGKKPFECHVCQHQFVGKDGLENHLRTHTYEKPFECKVCNSRFNYKHVLEKHFRVHTGEKPHQCVICKKYFARRFTLQTHLKKIHDWDTFNKKPRIA